MHSVVTRWGSEYKDNRKVTDKNSTQSHMYKTVKQTITHVSENVQQAYIIASPYLNLTFMPHPTSPILT